MYDLILLSLGLAAGLLIMLRLPRLPGRGEPGGESVSAVIPARDEADNIGQLVSSLRRQSLKPLEIICVDDESSDGTAGLARQAGAQAIPAGQRPPGWTGKTWACQIGAESARGDVLLFLDADVILSESALMKLMAAFRASDGVVSVQPYHVVRTLHEHFSMFFNILSVAATGMGIPFVRRTSGMFGPVLLVDRRIYARFGGHSAVRAKILDDFGLGKLYARNRIRVRLFAGGGDIGFRMYRGGFRDLWNGWTKNFYSGALNVSLPLFALGFCWITALTSAALSAVRAPFMPGPLAAAYAAAYGVAFAEVLIASRKVGNFHWLASLVYPVFLSGFHVIFIASLVKRLILKRAVWKGRVLDAGKG